MAEVRKRERSKFAPKVVYVPDEPETLVDDDPGPQQSLYEMIKAEPDAKFRSHPFEGVLTVGMIVVYRTRKVTTAKGNQGNVGVVRQRRPGEKAYGAVVDFKTGDEGERLAVVGCAKIISAVGEQQDRMPGT